MENKLATFQWSSKDFYLSDAAHSGTLCLCIASEMQLSEIVSIFLVNQSSIKSLSSSWKDKYSIFPK